MNGNGVSDTIEFAETWLLRNWRNVARGLGIPRQDERVAMHMRNDAAHQAATHAAIAGRRILPRWLSFGASRH